MASQFWIILVPLVAILANMAAQVAVYRLWNTEGRLFRSQMAGAVTGLAVLVVLSVSVRGPGTSAADSATANALIYLAFCYVYFHWNNMGETARRIRLLRELHDTPQGLTDAELHARYPAREILEHRLRRLLVEARNDKAERRAHLARRLLRRGLPLGCHDGVRTHGRHRILVCIAVTIGDEGGSRDG